MYTYLNTYQGEGETRKEGSIVLILTRKVDQGIVIQGNILIKVLEVERDRVKIGVSAPEEITVLRQELLEDKRGETANTAG